jgi:bacterial/archaeal transporter family-2 protein
MAFFSNAKWDCTAINGLLRIDIGAPFIVGTISFAVATLSMAVVLLLTMAVTDAPKLQLRGIARMPWWGGSAPSVAPPT